MRLIHNTVLAFRCTNDLRDRLQQVAIDNDMHVSQVVRRACVELLQRLVVQTGRTPS